MAVLSIRTKYDGWEGGATSEKNGLLYEIIRRRYKLVKIVRVSNPGDGPEVILTSVGIPQIGDAYNLFNDSDSLATCVAVGVPRRIAPLVWEIDCEFDTDRVISAITDNPLNQPADVRWDFNKYERPLIRAYDNGKACLTSSGNPYDPPLTWEDARPTVTIVRNEASFSPTFAFSYHNALNLETFATAEPLHAKINCIKGQQQFSNGLLFAQVTYEIELHRDSHAEFVMDQDFRDVDRKVFKDPVDFSSLPNPTLLNGRGRPLRTALGRVRAGQSTVGTMTLSDIQIGDTQIEIEGTDRFPPGAEVDNAGGYMPSGDWFFFIKIDNEILKVTTRKPMPVTWDVERAANGTTEAIHLVDAIVTLEPYFKRYLKGPVLSFTPLDLPVI